MHPEFLSMALFWIVAAYTPGPNNVVASYSGFNFGIKKTIPHIFGVTFGFTSVVFALTIGLVNVFKLFPIIQTILKYLGSPHTLMVFLGISQHPSEGFPGGGAVLRPTGRPPGGVPRIRRCSNRSILVPNIVG